VLRHTGRRELAAGFANPATALAMRSAAERMYLHTADEALFWHPPGAPAGAFASTIPGAPLSGFVLRIHFGHEWVDPARPVVERVLPDGGVHLIFNVGDPPSVPGESAAACIAAGARCQPSIIRMAGLVEHVTATLAPGGMAALLGVPAGELFARDVPLDALWGPAADEVRERMSAAPRGPARSGSRRWTSGRRCSTVECATTCSPAASPRPSWDRGAYLRGNLFYDVAKATMNRLAFAMAQELRPHGVASLAVIPGWMRTEFVLASKQASESTWREHPEFSRTESPRYVGRAVAALAADPGVMSKSGGIHRVADLAVEYGFTDIDGRVVPPFELGDG
jgi:hypothetical protein